MAPPGGSGAGPREFTVGLVTDLHFGPEALYRGKLRKLSAHAGPLLEAFVERMNREVRPDLVVNLGDDLEDESPAVDRARYAEVMAIFALLEAPVLHVAGNHDTVHLAPHDLLALWEPSGSGDRVDKRLYYARTFGGVRFLVLHTLEEKDRMVSVDDAQLGWVRRELEDAPGPVIVLMHHSAANQHLAGNRWFEGRPNICLVRERRRLRELFEASGKVLCVMNGHLHWNHLDVHAGIPYITVQSLIENLDADAPGRPAAAHAIVSITERRVLVSIAGEEPARYQFERPSQGPGPDLPYDAA